MDWLTFIATMTGLLVSLGWPIAVVMILRILLKKHDI